MAYLTKDGDDGPPFPKSLFFSFLNVFISFVRVAIVYLIVTIRFHVSSRVKNVRLLINIARYNSFFFNLECNGKISKFELYLYWFYDNVLQNMCSNLFTRIIG